MFALRQSLLLLLTAMLWGGGFVGQKLGMDYVSPFTFTFFRTFIGALFLVPVIMIASRIRIKGESAIRKSSRSDFIKGSLAVGFCLIAAETFQQYGLKYTDVHKASFITAMYVVLVPVLGLFIGQKNRARIWIAVAVSVAGLAFLTLKGGHLSMETGDLLVLVCALLFAVHVQVIDYWVRKVDGVLLSFGQFIVASALGLVLALASGPDSWESIKAAFPAILYCGIVSNGIAYTLQIVGQRGVNPAGASIILSLESAFGALAGVLFLGELITKEALMGCALMFTATMIAVIPGRKRRSAAGGAAEQKKEG